MGMLQIDVCALGPLRITHALYKGGKLERNGKPAKVIIITSQAGSCEWRFTQNPTPKSGDQFDGNYGHHMSRAATNMMGCILSQELKAADIQLECGQIRTLGWFHKAKRNNITRRSIETDSKEEQLQK